MNVSRGIDRNKKKKINNWWRVALSYAYYTLLDAAIHRISMNEQGRTHDGDFIRGALQRCSK